VGESWGLVCVAFLAVLEIHSSATAGPLLQRRSTVGIMTAAPEKSTVGPYFIAGGIRGALVR